MTAYRTTVALDAATETAAVSSGSIQGERVALLASIAAGLAGGLAEVGWMACAGAAGWASLPGVAAQVAATVGMPGAADLATAIAAIAHFALSVLVGVAYGMLLRLPWWSRRAGAAGKVYLALLLLIGIWSVNFLLLLPAVNPRFLGAASPGIGLISKLLFGLAMSLAWLAIERLGKRREARDVFAGGAGRAGRRVAAAPGSAAGPLGDRLRVVQRGCATCARRHRRLEGMWR